MTMPRLLLMIAVCLALASPAFAKKSRKPPGTIVPWKEVPATVQAGVQTNAAGAKVKEVQKITAANGAIVYCAEVKQTDGKWAKIYVNNSGTLIKTEQDNARNKRKHKPLFDF